MNSNFRARGLNLTGGNAGDLYQYDLAGEWDLKGQCNEFYILIKHWVYFSESTYNPKNRKTTSHSLHS